MLLIATALALRCMLVAPLGDLGSAAAVAGAGGASGASTDAGGSAEPDGGDAGGASGGATGGSAGASTCAVNQDCVASSGGEPYFCRQSDRTCVALKSGECPSVYGNAADPNAIVFGAFASLDPAQPEQSPAVLIYRLALDELSGSSQKGLPGGPGGTTRPLVMIVCNNDHTAVGPAMHHLADEVGVSAILAALNPQDMLDAFTNYRQGEIFFMNPVGYSTALAALEDHGLAWYMLGPPGDLAPAYTELLKLSEQYVRGNGGIGSSRPVKVALVSSTEAFDKELSYAVVSALRFNDEKTTTENEAQGTYLGLTVDPSNPQATASKIGRTVTEWGPDIIISTAGTQFTKENGVLKTVESLWGATSWEGGLLQRPFYMLSPTNYANSNDIKNYLQIEMTPVAMKTLDSVAYTRFVGISAARAADPRLQKAFALRLKMLYPGGDPDAENFYDAFYFLAYSMSGAGSVSSLTGKAIADGMVRLIDGVDQFEIGPDSISSVEARLSLPGNIRLIGTLGPSDFNRQTGARVDVGSVYCFKYQSQTSLALVSQVLRYDPHPDGGTTGKFTGTFYPPCFMGFGP